MGSKTYVLPKLFAAVCFTAIVLFLMFLLQTLVPMNIPLTKGILKSLGHEDLIYILQWTPGDHSPFELMGRGRQGFLDARCRFNNCYVTDDRGYFLNPTDFDAVLFNGKEIFQKAESELPRFRSSRQKFIMGSLESPHWYPACAARWDGYFNWTWSYRLDSEARWGYLSVLDAAGDVVGPARDVPWRREYAPVDAATRRRLRGKSAAAAWFVSNCRSLSGRELYAEQLARALAARGLRLDVFGSCGPHRCAKSPRGVCGRMLADTYHFYLAFENSLDEDYVTEKLLTALDNLAVPVVLGAANYSRFLPPGSYLDARDHSPERLAALMAHLMRDEEAYADFFRWRNHYQYQLIIATVGLCNLCELLNDSQKYGTVSVYHDFRKWWNPSIDNLCK